MLEDKTPRRSKQLQLYQGVQLRTIEVQVLERLEEGIGKPIPLTGKPSSMIRFTAITMLMKPFRFSIRQT